MLKKTLIKLDTTAMTSTKNEVCAEGLHEKCCLVDGNYFWWEEKELPPYPQLGRPV